MQSQSHVAGKPRARRNYLIFRGRSPGWSYWDWLKHLVVSWNWRMLDDHNVKVGPFVLEVTPYYMELLWREWRAWSKWYLPPWSLQGKTVLDIGAGCGETALFYYCHGAEKVIAVEPEPSLAPLLKRNGDRNRWNMEIIERPFDRSMLGWSFDFMKMDGEGCETQLLTAYSLPPCAIEVHNKIDAQMLEERFGLEVLPQKGNWILRNPREQTVTLIKSSERAAA